MNIIFDSIFERLVGNIAHKKKLKKKIKKVKLITYLREDGKLANLTQFQARFIADILNIP